MVSVGKDTLSLTAPYHYTQMYVCTLDMTCSVRCGQYMECVLVPASIQPVVLEGLV